MLLLRPAEMVQVCKTVDQYQMLYKYRFQFCTYDDDVPTIDTYVVYIYRVVLLLYTYL